MLHRGPTLANIRKLLAPYVPEAEIIDHARQLREAGLIPAGKPGRGGAGSARLDARQAALLLIALMCQGPTIGIAAETVRVGAFKLRDRVFWIQEGPTGRYFHKPLDLTSAPTFADFIEQSINMASAGTETLPPTVTVGQGIAFDLAQAQIPLEKGGGSWLFRPDQPGRARPPIMNERAIAGSLIAEIAELFDAVAPLDVSPELATLVEAAITVRAPAPERPDVS